jgi:hypothetical protein
MAFLRELDEKVFTSALFGRNLANKTADANPKEDFKFCKDYKEKADEKEIQVLIASQKSV